MNCLLIVDIQNDFLPGGSLAVPEGDRIVPIVNELFEHVPLVVATQDWHPAGHASFASSHPGRQPFEEIELDGNVQKLWPDHCVQGTPGADFPKELNLRPIAAIFRKGMDPAVDSYSGFFDNHRAHRTGLSGYLKELGVRNLFIAGLAAEVCVAFSAADGLGEGFAVTVVEDATGALDSEDVRKKKEDLTARGVRYLNAKELIAELG